MNYAATARERINDAAKVRILIKDGPYGTAIQNAKLSAEQYDRRNRAGDGSKGQ